MGIKIRTGGGQMVETKKSEKSQAEVSDTGRIINKKHEIKKAGKRIRI